MKKRVESIRVGRTTYSVPALSSMNEDEFLKMMQGAKVIKDIPKELKGKFKTSKNVEKKGGEVV